MGEEELSSLHCVSSLPSVCSYERDLRWLFPLSIALILTSYLNLCCVLWSSLLLCSWDTHLLRCSMKRKFLWFKMCGRCCTLYCPPWGNLSAHKDFKGSENSPREGKMVKFSISQTYKLKKYYTPVISLPWSCSTEPRLGSTFIGYGKALNNWSHSIICEPIKKAEESGSWKLCLEKQLELEFMSWSGNFMLRCTFEYLAQFNL